MSLLFDLVAKRSVEEGDKARFFSHPRKTPYMLFKYSIESNGEENVFTSCLLYNPRSEKLIEIFDTKFPKVLSEGSILLGTSRGWAVIIRTEDSTIHLSNVFNPWSSESSDHTIALPPFTDDLVPHSKKVINVSLSTPFPDREKDYIVSVTFFGSKLSYCMPNRDSEWTNINIPFSCDINSHVLYSRKDQMFYLLTTGCAYMVALDLKNNKKPKFLRLHFDNFPLIPQHEWELLASCLRSDYMAESSSGERFIVLWYVELKSSWLVNTIVYEKTKRFMVFRLEEEDKYQGGRIVANYTENIGDLCIFIGDNETFCLEASKFPGLRPNSIYYVSIGFGVYDIGNRRFREFDTSQFPTKRGLAIFLSPPLH